MFKLIYIFGHVFTVNSRCYGRRYVKKIIPLTVGIKHQQLSTVHEIPDMISYSQISS